MRSRSLIYEDIHHRPQTDLHHQWSLLHKFHQCTSSTCSKCSGRVFAYTSWSPLRLLPHNKTHTSKSQTPCRFADDVDGLTGTKWRRARQYVESTGGNLETNVEKMKLMAILNSVARNTTKITFKIPLKKLKRPRDFGRIQINGIDS